jgi:hypothetical protein
MLALRVGERKQKIILLLLQFYQKIIKELIHKQRKHLKKSLTQMTPDDTISWCKI